MAGPRTLLLVLPLLLAIGQAAAADPVGGDERAISVVNHARRAINEVYVSPVTSGDWGSDRLGEGTIAPGRSLRIRLGATRDCKVDVQVVYEDASREERHGLDICRDRQVVFDGSAATAPAGVGGAHPVEIVNDSVRPIQQVFISPADSGDWGDDLLRHASLSVGDRIALIYNGSCLADVRIVYDNRSAEERHTVDVCTLHGITVQPGWTTADRLPPMAAAHEAGGKPAR